uniref:Uncharacterized protein n=1 Tax=Aegilops tauschii subsp. strangulata TaxID=200361 RepID=A0A453NGX9_AEGTS|nr:uncharacterized protein LOC109734920 [Aegilops tauschii subsp. strangulata]
MSTNGGDCAGFRLSGALVLLHSGDQITRIPRHLPLQRRLNSSLHNTGSAQGKALVHECGREKSFSSFFWSFVSLTTFPGVTDLSNVDGQVCRGGEATSLVRNAGCGATSGWTRRIRIGNAPEEREMNPNRKTSLQLSVRAYGEKGVSTVVLLDTRTVFYALP